MAWSLVDIGGHFLPHNHDNDNHDHHHHHHHHHHQKQSVEEFQQTQTGEPVQAWQVDFAPLRIKLATPEQQEKLKLDPNAYLDDDDEEEDGEEEQQG